MLPYDRKHYKDYLTDDVEMSFPFWYGISFQLHGDTSKMHLTEFIEIYKPWFDSLVSKFKSDSCWIVNHISDVKWFPNSEQTLPLLRTLFKQHHIPNNFKGAILFDRDDLLKFSSDLISYPNNVFAKETSLYNDLEISHAETPFIIHISGHLNIDLLSTDKQLLNKIVNENRSDIFNLKEYRGTSLSIS